MKKYLISINGKKKFKRILSCFFGGRQKIQVTSFAFEDVIFVVFCCHLKVGTSLTLQHLAAVPSPNVVELFFCCCFYSVHKHGFCDGPNTFSQEKHRRVYFDQAAIDKHMHFVTGKEISSKINANL